ncbi:hypothetical protein [Haloarchaeobius sp. DFWS5]|uniref:hypothetical protein n=1 Tax=Haloarchaeobius sp. DFWS5 TaxID=3446114 RepID=UPI003EBB13CF
MNIQRGDVVKYVYTVGVIASGVVLQRSLGANGAIPTMAVAALFAVGWTAYYNWTVEPRIEQWEQQ